MKGRSQTFTQIPLEMVGSSKFGRYPKISIEQTYNMIISDDVLVPYAGHRLIRNVLPQGVGRAIFTSNFNNQMYAVIGNGFYAMSTNETITRIASLATAEGDVFIDENNGSQLALTDKYNIYIYNYQTGAFTVVGALGFIPGYISFQNGRFICPALGTNTWELSEFNNGLVWPENEFTEGSMSTKPDSCVAAQRFPGKGNLLFVFGNTVIEQWQDVGFKLFPYVRNSGSNIDFGCISAATIAYNDSFMVWLGKNEKSGAVIMYSDGASVRRISTDGIDFKFAELTNPSNSFGFLFMQDGHQIYQISFPDDGLTYSYDFNTQKFFTITDENMGCHIARKIAYFNNKYYFVSYKDGGLYEMSTQFTTYSGHEIPRIRIPKPIRMPDASRFAVNNVTFTLEQGMAYDSILNDPLQTESGLNLLTESNEIITVTESLDADGENPLFIKQKVYLSASKDGGESFGTIWSKELNKIGKRRNRLIYWNLGAANDCTLQFRFYGLGRFVVMDGITSIYQ